MKKSRMTFVAIGICAAMVLSGCSKEEEPVTSGAAATAASEDHLSQIKAKGKIVIAMEGTWAPWTYHDDKGELTGYDVAVGKKIAEKIGVTPEFVEGKWDGLLAGLSAGRYDLMINGVGVTPQRSEAYDFSEPYALDRMVVMVKGDRTDITKMEDLKGKTTANTISSTYAEQAEKYGAKVTGVDDLNQTFELLLGGRIDATLNAEVTYYDYMKAHPGADVKIAAAAPETTQIAIPLRKGAATASLREAVNQTIREMRESGELSKLSETFFGIDIATEKK